MSDWSHLEGEEQFEKAKEEAYRFLGRRERSEHEVCEHLRGKGYETEVVEAVLGRLKELDYVNNRRFTLLWVKDRAFSKQKGSEFLKKELLNKGISLNLIEDILEAEFNPENEYVVALECAKKKLKSYPKDPAIWKSKLWRFLAQRGFQGEIIVDVITTLLAVESEE